MHINTKIKKQSTNIDIVFKIKFAFREFNMKKSTIDMNKEVQEKIVYEWNKLYPPTQNNKLNELLELVESSKAGFGPPYPLKPMLGRIPSQTRKPIIG